MASFFLKVVFCLFALARPAQAGHTYLRIHIESTPKTLDPAQATGVREFQILQAIFEGLTRYHPKSLKPLPGVAEKWTLSPDGKTYRFHLRHNAKWNDGAPVTAGDFWYAWEHLLNPKTVSPYAFQLFYLQGAEEYAQGKFHDPKKIGMRIIDDQTFEVTLKKPVPYFLDLTAFAALAPRRKGWNETPHLANGPFFVESNSPEKGITLLPNKHYWGRSEVKLYGVIFRPFGDFAAALKFYGRTGIDIMADLPPRQVPLLKFRSDFRSSPLLRTEFFVIQCQKPPFDKRDVRQALAYAIDRHVITDKILKRGDLAYGLFVPPGIPDYQNPSHPQTFDPWRAKHLLSKAGFGPQNKFPTMTLHHDPATDRLMVAKTVQEMWQKHLGIKVDLLEEEWPLYLERRQKRDYQISWGGWYGDYLDPKTFLELFSSDNRQNHAAWSNPRYDELVKKAEETLDRTQRAKLYSEAEALLLREAPVIPILVKSKNYLIQPYVKGFFPNLLDIHPLRDVYSLRP